MLVTPRRQRARSLRPALARTWARRRRAAASPVGAWAPRRPAASCARRAADQRSSSRGRGSRARRPRRARPPSRWRTAATEGRTGVKSRGLGVTASRWFNRGGCHVWRQHPRHRHRVVQRRLAAHPAVPAVRPRVRHPPAPRPSQEGGRGARGRGGLGGGEPAAPIWVLLALGIPNHAAYASANSAAAAPSFAHRSTTSCGTACAMVTSSGATTTSAVASGALKARSTSCAAAGS